MLVVVIGFLSGIVELKNEWLGSSRLNPFASDAAGSVDVDVTLYEESGEFPASQYPGRSDIYYTHKNILKFTYGREDEKIRIKYEAPYLTLLSKGGPIQPLKGLGGDKLGLIWQFPALAVKVVNNTNRTLFLTEAALEVLSSEVNKEPVLVIHTGEVAMRIYYYEGEAYIVPLGTFHLLNEGWGDVLNATVDYEAKATGPNNLNFRYAKGSRKLGTFSERAEVVVIPNIPNEARDCSEHERPSLVDVSGTVKYETEMHKHRAVSFNTKVFISMCTGPLGVTVPNSSHDVLLEAGKANYTKYVPIAQEIKPGATDHFLFNLGTDKSASLDLKLTLREAGGAELPSKRVLIDTFVPRSVASIHVEMDDPKRFPNLQKYRKMRPLPPRAK